MVFANRFRVAVTLRPLLPTALCSFVLCCTASACDPDDGVKGGAEEFACRPVCPGVQICANDYSDVRAVPIAQRCDNKADCPFADDEEDCPGSEVLFCSFNDEGLKTVYEPSQACDGHQDCYWAEDERDCPGFFACRSDGPGVESLPAEKVCDGKWDCANDEYDCPGVIDPYTCPDGRRIAREFVCDGIEDCHPVGEDGSEELEPSCHQFRCKHFDTGFDRMTSSFDDPWYIDQSKVCDGKRDCHAGDDEEECPQKLTQGAQPGFP